jgi:hypothetical protein
MRAPDSAVRSWEFAVAGIPGSDHLRTVAAHDANWIGFETKSSIPVARHQPSVPLSADGRAGAVLLCMVLCSGQTRSGVAARIYHPAR